MPTAYHPATWGSNPKHSIYDFFSLINVVCFQFNVVAITKAFEVLGDEDRREKLLKQESSAQSLVIKPS